MERIQALELALRGEIISFLSTKASAWPHQKPQRWLQEDRILTASFGSTYSRCQKVSVDRRGRNGCKEWMDSLPGLNE